MRRHGHLAFYTVVAGLVAAIGISAPAKADVVLTSSSATGGDEFYEAPGAVTTVGAAPVGASAPGMFYNPAVSSASAPVGEFYDLALNPPIAGVSDGSAPVGEFYDLALNPPITTGSAGGTNFGIYSSSDGITVTTDDSLPEPMSMALLGSGLAGLALVRRRRR